MLPNQKAQALKRLNYIEGYVAGVRRMVEEDRYCVDILKQTYAIRRAIKKMEQIFIEGHLHSCVVTGVNEGREEEVLGELVELYAMGDR